MRRVGLVPTIAAIAFVALGSASAQSGQQGQNFNRGWSQMMMGPMAGCPMGAGNQGMMGPYMMGNGGNSGMMGPGMMQGGMMGGYGGAWGQGSASVSPQLDSLHATLGIRHEQQGAWDAYAAAARADSRSMYDMHNRMLGFMQGQTTSATDWLHVHRDMMRTRAASLDALSNAVDRLYGQLDAGQKANFDRYGGGLCGAW